MSESEASTGFDLHRFIRVVSRHAWVVALATVAVVGPAVAWSNAKIPQYRASAEMVIEPGTSELLFMQDKPGGDGGETARSIATETKRLRSKPVTQAAARKLGYVVNPDDISTESSGLDNVIEITVVSTDRRRAPAIANTLVVAYIQGRRSAAIKDLLEAQSEIQKKIDEKQRELDALNAEVGAAPPAQKAALDQARNFERQSLVNQQGLFREQVDQLQVNARLNSGGGELLSPAEVPDAPFEPRVVRTGSTALVAGLMLGVGLAFGMNLLDDTVKGDEDLQRTALGLPVLGSIPLLRGWKKDRTVLVSLAEPSSPAAEAYRGLRTSVQFIGVDRPLSVVQITSPAVSEGKTTTAANLAVALARSGRRVIVVDCDLRRPRVHQFFELSSETGLTSVLVGEVSLDNALKCVPGDDFSLQVLASGPLPPNPSELLAGQRFTDVLAALRARADIVVVDSPPVLVVSDAAVLSPNMDATVVVLRPGRTSHRDLKRALTSLRQVNAPLAGLVLNGVGRGGLYSYTHYRDDSPKVVTKGDKRALELEPVGANGRSAPDTGSPVEQKQV